jgi:hypothetical protein
MKTYEEVEAQLHPFLSSAQDWDGQLQVSVALPPEEEPPVPSGWKADGPHSRSEKIISCFCRESHPDSSHRPARSAVAITT